MGKRGAMRRLAALGLLVLGACQSPGTGVEMQPVPAGPVSLENGRAVFHAGGCASCHASPGQLIARTPVLGGGRVLRTSLGVFRAPNISSDPATGIGAWSRADFARAMRRGIAPDGRAYYPAFPYPSYTRMSDRDIADLQAYLASLPPVTNQVAASRLAIPVGQGIAARLWQRLYLRPGPAVALRNATPEVARGQYLAEGPGHCGSCHTPRTGLGGPRTGLWLGGAEMPDESGFAPNLTPHEQGLGDRSPAEIVEALRPAGPPGEDDEGMDAVRASLAHLPESDLYAIAAYLKTLPPVAPPPDG